MENMNVPFGEEQKMTDLLCSQKFVTSVYNTYYCEAENSFVKNCLSTILQDEHNIQQEIFNALNTHGWYQPEKAEETKLNTTKQKFGQNVTV